MSQKSLVLIKPDGVQRRLVSTILQRFETAGLKLHALKFLVATTEQSRSHYREHVDKGFYPMVEDYITEGPIVALVLSGGSCIPKIRQMVGATTPAEAAPGTIRGDLAHQPMTQGGALRNLIHASASPEEAEHELGVWFTPDEIVDYALLDDRLHS
ncbi:MAG TPA: nucleoside-diphosphate kinase [Lentisphaeria bacterium]|jgi:nucleoside-diphosphate kinase|nr:nucleoside-diphosphate kinase [Lentisphaeria bacterium]